MTAGVGFAALGAGMLHLALAIGSPIGPAVALIGFGAVELLWGVLVVARGRVLVPRTAAAVALLPLVAWTVILVAGDSVGSSTDAVRVFPALVATLLDLAVAIGIIALLRRPADPESPTRPVGVIAAALVVAALALPALAATEAGERLGPAPSAPPHPGYVPH